MHSMLLTTWRVLKVIAMENPLTVRDGLASSHSSQMSKPQIGASQPHLGRICKLQSLRWEVPMLLGIPGQRKRLIAAPAGVAELLAQMSTGLMELHGRRKQHRHGHMPRTLGRVLTLGSEKRMLGHQEAMYGLLPSQDPQRARIQF